MSRKGFQGLTIDNKVTYLIHLVIRENNSSSPAPIQLAIHEMFRSFVKSTHHAFQAFVVVNRKEKGYR